MRQTELHPEDTAGFQADSEQYSQEQPTTVDSGSSQGKHSTHGNIPSQRSGERWAVHLAGAAL